MEIKTIDAAANPYLASALVLEAARIGIAESMALPDEVARDPAALAPHGVERLPTGIPTLLPLLEASPVAVRALGPDILSAFTAVRSREHATFGEEQLSRVCERLRFAWTT